MLKEINGYTFLYHPRAIVPACPFLGTSLEDVYGRYSWRKENAFAYCKRMAHEFNSHGWICSYNCQFFIFAFDFADADDKWYRAYITPSYNHLYHLEH